MNKEICYLCIITNAPLVALSLDDKSAAQIRNFWSRNDKLEVIGVSMQNDGVTCINNNINRKGLKKAA